MTLRPFLVTLSGPSQKEYHSWFQFPLSTTMSTKLQLRLQSYAHCLGYKRCWIEWNFFRVDMHSIELSVLNLSLPWPGMLEEITAESSSQPIKAPLLPLLDYIPSPSKPEPVGAMKTKQRSASALSPSPPPLAPVPKGRGCLHNLTLLWLCHCSDFSLPGRKEGHCHFLHPWGKRTQGNKASSAVMQRP